MNKKFLQRTLNLGDVAQVGIVVRDLAKSIETYEQVIGIGPFTRFSFKPEKCFVKGRNPGIHLEIGVAQLTPAFAFELIQVVDGHPYHRDFLEQHGEGVQHLGFMTQAYDAVLERAAGLGIEVLMWAEADVPGMGRIRGAYLDTCEQMGVLVEIIEINSSNME